MAEELQQMAHLNLDEEELPPVPPSPPRPDPPADVHIEDDERAQQRRDRRERHAQRYREIAAEEEHRHQRRERRNARERVREQNRREERNQDQHERDRANRENAQRMRGKHVATTLLQSIRGKHLADTLTKRKYLHSFCLFCSAMLQLWTARTFEAGLSPTAKKGAEQGVHVYIQCPLAQHNFQIDGNNFLFEIKC